LKHFASPDFWEYFGKLPGEVQRQAREDYKLLRANPRHPSLHFKKVGGYWSVRIGLAYRALGSDVEGGILWGWIGTHSEYDRLIKE
jgi:hypothetical protein